MRGRVGPKRAVQWVASVDSTGPTPLAAATAVLDQSFGFGEDATIVRLRGGLWVQSDQQTATETAFGALGFAVVSDQALAIGITAVPTPITDEASDLWFLWEPFAAAVRFASGVGFDSNPMQHTVLDSKAMRKVNDGTSVVAVVENASASAGLTYVLKFRMLVKLHG